MGLVSLQIMLLFVSLLSASMAWRTLESITLRWNLLSKFSLYLSWIIVSSVSSSIPKLLSSGFKIVPSVNLNWIPHSS